MLRALAWRRTGDRSQATRLAVMTGRGLGVFLMVAGAGLVVVTGEISAIWLVAIGWFLFEAAATSAIQEAFAKRVEGLTLADVMRPTELAINGDSTVAEALQIHGWGDKLRPMPVAVDGRVMGVFGTREVVAVHPDERGATPVRDAMAAIGPDDVIAGEVPLRRALARHTGGSGLIVVVEAGEVVGLITGEEMAGILGDLRRGE